MSGDVALVAMRLSDMTRMHPRQDDSKACSKCGCQVGLYPSGQKVLTHNPKMRIICNVCIQGEPPAVNMSAAPLDEIIQESRDSLDVGKA